MILIYRLLINLILIFSPIIIFIRLIYKKEDPKRFLEKFTLFSQKRKKGTLIWFHAVSVGELISIIPLVKKLEKNKKISQILITSTTLTSSTLFTNFKFKKTIHQYFPIDNNYLTKRFLRYWNPKLAIFIDSEIWPNMLHNLKKNSVMRILLNARINKKSYNKWKKLGRFSENLFQSFNKTYPQNKESQKYLKKLKVKNIHNLGNLKFSQSVEEMKKIPKNLNNLIFKKKIWCASSTHQGEEEICLKIHQKLIKKFKDLILIIIPRHTYRINDITKDLLKYNMKFHLHSNKKPIQKNINVYLVDTYGETNIFFSICKNIFLGKSITTDGGQNPLEPARHNCTIIHGPHVSNFTEIYSYLDKLKISFKVNNEIQLTNKLYTLIKKGKKNIKISSKINKIGDKVLKKNLNAIESFL